MKSTHSQTNLDARLLLTRTMPTLHPLYMALAMKLFMKCDLSPSDDCCIGDKGALVDPSPFPTINGAISTSESFILSLLPWEDDPSSTSSMFFFALLGDRTDIPVDEMFGPIDILFIVLFVGWVVPWWSKSCFMVHNMWSNVGISDHDVSKSEVAFPAI